MAGGGGGGAPKVQCIYRLSMASGSCINNSLNKHSMMWSGWHLNGETVM